MHAPLAKFSMMRRLMSSAAWWLSQSAIDIDFQNNRAHDGIALDPLRASTVLMLHGDGADASTNISDSTGRHFITTLSVEIDTAQSKFGGASMVSPGGVANIAAGVGADFQFGTGDFTIDFWLRLASIGNAYNIFDFRGGDSSNVAYPLIYYDNGSGKLVYFTNGNQIVGTVSLAANTWYHVALIRTGTTVKMFVNGTQDGSNFTDATAYSHGTGGLYIFGSPAQSVNGWIDEFRIVKGVAAWTANFTPPTMPYNVGVGPYDLLSCSRASTGYAQTAAGTLTQFAANQLRITDKGLLVEDTRTNVAKQSQRIGDDGAGAPWTDYGSIISHTLNAAVAPDGTTTASRLFENSTTSNIYQCYQAVGGTSNGVPYTCSVYAKAGTTNWIKLCGPDTGTNIGAWFDLTNGVVGTVDSGFTASIEALANGWYRCSVTRTTTSAFDEYFHIFITTADNTLTHIGVVGRDVYVWGAQFELGAFASSYIPTTTAGLARALDFIQPVRNLNTVLTAPTLSILADVITDHVLVDITAEQFYIIGSSAAITPMYSSTGGGKANHTIGFYNGTNVNDVLIGNSLTFSGGFKAGAAVGASGNSVIGGGGSVVSDATPWPGMTSPQIGGWNANTRVWCGYMRRLTFWDEKLADATLQALTSPTGPSPTNYAIDLNFQTGGYTVNARPQFYLTCSRASIGYAQTVAGTLTQFPANALRITDLGLLIEDTRTNLLLRSQEMDVSPWDATNNVTVNANAAVAPDGTTTADKLTATAADCFLAQSSSVTPTNGVVYTFSVYLKADAPVTIKICVAIDVTADTTCNVTTSWQRFTLTYTSTGVGNLLLIGGSASFSTGEIVYAWGAQFEAGAFASSYIPTTTGSLARAADNVLFAGALKTVIEGTDVSFIDEVKDIGLFVGANYVTNITINPIQYLSNTQMRSYVYGESIDVTIGNSLTFAANVVKMGVCWAASGRSAVAGGGTVGTGFNVPSAETGLGFYNASATHSYVYHRRLTAWNTRLADATLQGFTNP